MEIFKFELELKEQQVELDGDLFTIFELTGKQRDEYLNSVSQRVNYVNGKAAGMKNLTGLQSSLIALCLKDEAGKSVKETDIQQYPSSVQTKLFEIAQELSGLGKEEDPEKAEEEAKND